MRTNDYYLAVLKQRQFIEQTCKKYSLKTSKFNIPEYSNGYLVISKWLYQFNCHTDILDVWQSLCRQIHNTNLLKNKNGIDPRNLFYNRKIIIEWNKKLKSIWGKVK